MLRELALLSLSAAAAPGQTFLAYQGTGFGCIFLGYYDQRRFIDTTKNKGAIDPYSDAGRALVPAFAAGNEYPAISASGASIRVLVTDVSPKQDLPTYRFHANTSGPVLITTARLPLEAVPAVSARLTRTAEQQIQLRARQLWEHALSERSPGEKPVSYSPGGTQVTTIGGGSGMLAVYYPLNIEPGHDRRGSMFFLYSRKTSRIIRAEFGHPEWAFQSSARTIRPEFYFRVKGSPEEYFLAEYTGGWEDRAYAILNLRTGKTELYCY